MAATPTGRGYMLLGADGGIFTFGDARFYGSTGGLRLQRAGARHDDDADGTGYWFVAADGGVFTFGDARFHGSTGDMRLSSPVASMTAAASGSGYWLVADDGGIFAFGVPFVGSLPGLGIQSLPVGVRIRALAGGRGYYILGLNGAVYTFGTARFFGSRPLPTTTNAVDLMLARKPRKSRGLAYLSGRASVGPGIALGCRPRSARPSTGRPERGTRTPTARGESPAR